MHLEIRIGNVRYAFYSFHIIKMEKDDDIAKRFSTIIKEHYKPKEIGVNFL